MARDCSVRRPVSPPSPRRREALRAGRPARGRPAARADRRADAPRRARGELLVPPPPRRLRVDRGAGRRACASPTSPAGRATAPTCSPTRAAEVVGIDANPEAHEHATAALPCARTCASSATSSRTSPGRSTRSSSCRRSSTSRTCRRCSRAIATAAPLAFISTPNRLTLAPEGAEKSDNPWHLREYTIGEYRAAARARLRRGRDPRPLPRGQARGPRARDRARLGPGPLAAADHQALLRPLHAGDQRRRLRAPAGGRGRPRRGAGLRRRLPRMTAAPTAGGSSRERAAAIRTERRRHRDRPPLATCPTSRASAPIRSARSGSSTPSSAPISRFSAIARDLTMTVTPVLADQLEDAGVARADAGVRPRVPGRLGRARRPRRRGGAASPPARPRPAATPTRSTRLEDLGGEPLAAFRDAAGPGRLELMHIVGHARRPAADRDPRGPDAPARHRDPLAPAPLRAGARRLASRVRLRGRASSTSWPSSASSISAPISRPMSRPLRRSARSRPMPP